jgi:hypothetical protein
MISINTPMNIEYMIYLLIDRVRRGDAAELRNEQIIHIHFVCRVWLGKKGKKAGQPWAFPFLAGKIGDCETRQPETRYFVPHVVRYDYHI